MLAPSSSTEAETDTWEMHLGRQWYGVDVLLLLLLLLQRLPLLQRQRQRLMEHYLLRCFRHRQLAMISRAQPMP